ncbi:MAG: TraR/DksA C4-type zinc finger protein [Gemmatimonadota bacterium]
MTKVLGSLPAWMASPDLELEGRFQINRWPVERQIWVEGERLRWRISLEDKARMVKAGPGLLADFVALHEAEADAIEVYARAWGPIRVCDHGLPVSHNRAPSYLSLEVGCRPRSTGEMAYDYWEPIDVWRDFSRRADAILSVAAQLHVGEQGRLSDWVELYEWRGIAREKLAAADSETERWLLSSLISEWLWLGGVAVGFDWSQESPQVALVGPGLFGQLATQLAMTVAKTDGFAFCSACGRPYVPKRRPANGRRNYCLSCQDRARWRDAKRAQRQRSAKHVEKEESDPRKRATGGSKVSPMSTTGEY